MIYNLYDWTDAPEMANVDMLAYCVMGDHEQSFATFDGEFEGLTPLDHLRKP